MPGLKRIWTTKDPEHSDASRQRPLVCQVTGGDCPACGNFLLLLRRGAGNLTKNSWGRSSYDLKIVEQEEILFPKYPKVSVEPKVPSAYKEEFVEASLTLRFSPKASAALSRRLLQRVLRERFSIEHRGLAQEIDAFLQHTGVPSHLAEAVDAVRNVGNFAAHPVKDTNTGEIVEVELGEAEWLLEVVESLFDFSFVQPNRLTERKKKLNEKLRSVGRPPMRG